MCFVFISEQTATCATYCINWSVFITEMKSVYSAVRTGALNKAVCAWALKGDQYSWVLRTLVKYLWKSHIFAQPYRGSDRYLPLPPPHPKKEPGLFLRNISVGCLLGRVLMQRGFLLLLWFRPSQSHCSNHATCQFIFMSPRLHNLTVERVVN